MILRRIEDYKSANRFIEDEFIPYYNRKFARYEGIESVFRPLPKSINLDLITSFASNKVLTEGQVLIFSKRFKRKVNNDNTIKFEGNIIQLPPSQLQNFSFWMRS